MIVPVNGPTHSHDCGSCRYIGAVSALPNLTPEGATSEDLYLCSERGESTLVRRHGSDGEHATLTVSNFLTHYAEPSSDAADSKAAPVYRHAYLTASRAGLL